jgi:tetratricopeptide (TPR) repeat protein
MIYAERRLSLEQFMHKYLHTGKMGDYLKADISRLEDDMPVLHDRRLFLLERAKRNTEGHPEKAYDAFTKVLKRLDQEIIKDEKWKDIRYECLMRLGLAAMNDGRQDQGVPMLLEYLEHNPRHMRAQRIVSEYLYDQGQYDQAIPHLKVCLTGAAQDDNLWFRLGRCFFETERPVAAYKCFETATERTRDNYFFSARAYSRAGKLPQAIKLFQQVLKVDSRDGEAIYYLAGALASAGEDKKAVKVLRLVPSEHAYYARVLTLRGNLLLRKGDSQDAADRHRRRTCPGAGGSRRARRCAADLAGVEADRAGPDRGRGAPDRDGGCRALSRRARRGATQWHSVGFPRQGGGTDRVVDHALGANSCPVHGRRTRDALGYSRRADRADPRAPRGTRSPRSRRAAARQLRHRLVRPRSSSPAPSSDPWQAARAGRAGRRRSVRGLPSTLARPRSGAPRSARVTRCDRAPRGCGVAILGAREPHPACAHPRLSPADARRARCQW